MLSAVAGSADVTSFLCFHEIFTSAMTGNIAILAIALGQEQFVLASRSMIALLAYILGVLVATSLLPRTLWQNERLFLLETTSLLGLAGCWWLWGFPETGWPLFLMILLSAFAMGIQSVLARGINIAGVPSVVFTNTLTSLLMGLVKSHRLRQSPAWETHQQLAALLAYCLGALIVAALLRFLPSVAINLPWILVLVVWYLGKQELYRPLRGG